MELETFGITDIGLRRENNEDAFVEIEEKRFFALADGMGGHLAGEIAATVALKTLCDAVLSASSMSLEKTCKFLRAAMAQANTQVIHQARTLPECAGMGTTLSCFTLTEQHLVYAHIGDSRLYRYRPPVIHSSQSKEEKAAILDEGSMTEEEERLSLAAEGQKGRLSQLTQDHSLRRKSLSQTSIYRNHHVITRAIGTHSVILPDLGVTPIYSKDLYMLCSDGLSDYVPEEMMEEVLGSSLPIQKKGETLVKMALKKGGRDNITLLLVQVN